METNSFVSFIFGPQKFSSIWHTIPHISKKVLNSTLKEMLDDRLLVRQVANNKEKTVTYELTSKGRDLGEVFEGMRNYAKTHIPNALEIEHIDLIKQAGM